MYMKNGYKDTIVISWHLIIDLIGFISYMYNVAEYNPPYDRQFLIKYY